MTKKQKDQMTEPPPFAEMDKATAALRSAF